MQLSTLFEGPFLGRTSFLPRKVHEQGGHSQVVPLAAELLRIAETTNAGIGLVLDPSQLYSDACRPTLSWYLSSCLWSMCLDMQPKIWLAWMTS